MHLQKIQGVYIVVMNNKHMQSESSLPSDAQQKAVSILLIDDEAEILTLFKRSLGMSGFSTYGFMNPKAAVEHFRQNPKAYDIVITDVRMPEMNGFEVVRAIKKINPDVKVVMTSSFEMSIKEVKSLLPSLNINDVIEKPITLQRLNEIIRNLQK